MNIPKKDQQIQEDVLRRVSFCLKKKTIHILFRGLERIFLKNSELQKSLK